MKLERVDVSITGNTANAIRFHPFLAGIYKKWCVENAGRISPCSAAARAAPCTDKTRRADFLRHHRHIGMMHGDVQFAGSSSVPAMCR
jgi:hypothetical protein